MLLIATFTKALEAHATPFSAALNTMVFTDGDASGILIAAIESSCTCPGTRFRRDGQCLVVDDKRVDPIPAGNAVQGLQWDSHIF